MTAILAIAGVVAGYLPQVDILNGVDVHVDEGELVVVVGPNGAGKSTLLKLVIGLLAPKRGTVILAGEAIAGLPPSRIVRQGPGYVPQRENIFEGLPVEENLEIGLRPRRDLRLADRLEALYALFPRLEERRRQLAGNLSGGVGTCCVQLAKQAGGTVIACASSEEKLARLKALGADVGLDYIATDWVAECRRLFGRARVRLGRGRHRRGGQLHRRRQLGALAQGDAPRRTAPHLRCHRRLRSGRGSPAHLDLRAQHRRVERLVARRRAGAARVGPPRHDGARPPSGAVSAKTCRHRRGPPR